MQYRLDLAAHRAAGREGFFHPAVTRWLEARFGAATGIQQRAWAVTSRHRHTLIAAPTGSGKTLAAFLSAINDLVERGLDEPLPDRVQVLYVSPLKALSNDIQKNLQEPLAGIRAQLAQMGLPDVAIRDAVRTGDTPVFERQRMRKLPPHILVTTPESLFILMTSQAGRSMLGDVRTVIIDELHAVAGGKRGAHLMLTLERLAAFVARPFVRIGLSATVKPLDEIAHYLLGQRDGETVEIVDAGHVRERDLALELPKSPLMPVMATEVWAETYDRLAELVAAHKTTLIFVNQRRLAERAARHLAERIGETLVTAHHGSLSREHRLQAETRLKNGELKALVATSSLELGIDIGDIDLVCQLGSPRAINAFLQRVGRAGHAIGAVPKGRLFPLTQDDLLECAALFDAVNAGELDRIRLLERPLDVLAQQIVAEVGCDEWGLDALYECLRRAHPYHALPREDFERVVQMLADGYITRRGRRGAYLHLDAVNRRLRARAGAKLAAVMNAGTIPDQFDYDVVLQPDGHRVGTLNEDFAFESMAGDIFQLGNRSYRVLKVETARVLVEDAHGLPPSIPFWLGDAPGRSDELSAAVGRLNARAQAVLAGGGEALPPWLVASVGLPPAAAQQLADYWASAFAMLGDLPSADCVILERFYDEVGDAHLVIHSPFGLRVNRAWGLALRKRFCRTFNFELQASALEDSIVLSLGPTHSFPLDSVARFLHSASAREVLVQALLDAPMFATRWRWNATVALGIRRMNAGRRVPPQFQRSDSEDLLTLVFPDQVACAENLTGERQIPDHPLVRQTIDDCLHDTMDIDAFERVLRGLESGAIRLRCCELATPSPLAQAVINAKPWAFLDDGAKEERRTRSIASRPLMDLATAERMSRLDPEAVARVGDEVWPLIRNAEELHDALVVHGLLTEGELLHGRAQAVGGFDGATWAGRRWLDALIAQRRVARLCPLGGEPFWFAAERAHEVGAVWAGQPPEPALQPLLAASSEAGEGLRELLRSRLDVLGLVSLAELARPLGLPTATVEAALQALEAEGAVVRGDYDGRGERWCGRRLMVRLQRQSRDRQRAAIAPATPVAFMRFLFSWQRLTGSGGELRHDGEAGLLAALQQLEGVPAAMASWEEDLLPARVCEYSPLWLDRLCASGRLAWTRPPVDAEAARRRSGPVRTTPVLFAERECLPYWQGSGDAPGEPEAGERRLSSKADRLLQVLRQAGASFYSDLLADSGLLGAELEAALGELVSHGLVSCDNFAGLRALTMTSEKRDRLRRHFGRADVAFDEAGRWSLIRRRPPAAEAGRLAEPQVEHIARVLLRRYGVVFRALLERESGLPSWRELHYVYRRLEARAEVLGGRYVSGFSGEQFALPEAATQLARFQQGVPGRGAVERICIGATDPLNLVGILLPGERVPRQPGNRILFEDGLPVAVLSGGDTQFLREVDLADQWEIRNALLRHRKPFGFLVQPRLPQ